MKTTLISLISSIAFSSALDVTSDYFGKYLKIDINDDASGFGLHQPLSYNNGTAVGFWDVDIKSTDMIYLAEEDNGFIRLKHINDNKCLYVEAATNNLLSWECWNDTNMRFSIQNDTGYGLRIKHETSGKCLQAISGSPVGGDCEDPAYAMKVSFIEVFPYVDNTGLDQTYRNLRFESSNCAYLDSNGETIYHQGSYSCSQYYYGYAPVFKFHESANNTFRIMSVDNGKCMYVETGTNNVKFWECWDDSNMRFYHYIDELNRTRIVHEQSGLCLGIDSNVVTAGECGQWIRYDKVGSIASSEISNIYNDKTSDYINPTAPPYYTYHFKINNMCLILSDTAGYFDNCLGVAEAQDQYQLDYAQRQRLTVLDAGNGLVNIRTGDGTNSCMLGSAVDYFSGNVVLDDCYSQDQWVLDRMTFRMLEKTYESGVKLQHAHSGMCLAYTSTPTGEPDLVDCDAYGEAFDIDFVSL